VSPAALAVVGVTVFVNAREGAGAVIVTA